jgi:hypothetical protein
MKGHKIYNQWEDLIRFNGCSISNRPGWYGSEAWHALSSIKGATIRHAVHTNEMDMDWGLLRMLTTVGSSESECPTVSGDPVVALRGPVPLKKTFV